MRLTDIIRPDCIKVPLQSTDKRAAIDELIELIAGHGYINDPAPLKLAVWERESTRTTGIGHGLAIPHGKCDCCNTLVMAIGKPAVPIDFQSIDSKPVNLIFLLASPTNQTGPHIQALAKISRLMTNDKFRAAIRSAPTAKEVYDLIFKQEEAEEQAQLSR